MTNIRVNPAVLAWARRERGLTEAEAARRLSITEQEFREIETATELPLGRLREIASKYAITFASLLMPEPLPDSTRLRVKDFRTHGGRAPQVDHDLLLLLDDLNEQIDLLAEVKAADGELFAAPTLPRASLESDAEELADAERRRIGPPVAEQTEWDKETKAFRCFRAVAEKQGIFVYAAPLGPRSNCRGLSVLDERGIPVAVINADEKAYRPRNFTLWHEYAHILLRETGISDENRSNKVERFCNQFAAFFLMPRQSFTEFAKLIAPKKGRPWTEYHVQRLAKRFWVSLTVASYHMEDVNLVPDGHYDENRRLWSMYRPKKPGGIATHAEKKLNLLGVHHVNVVFRALDRGRISKLDAYELLGVRSKDFDAIRSEAAARQEAYGGAG